VQHSGKTFRTCRAGRQILFSARGQDAYLKKKVPY